VYSDFTARVRAGAALLDEKKPGWLEKIRPAELNITDQHQCVLGQVFGCYGSGLEALSLHTGTACSYGFDASGSVGTFDSPASQLQRAWLALLSPEGVDDEGSA
jgi:hypothetical protein